MPRLVANTKPIHRPAPPETRTPAADPDLDFSASPAVASPAVAPEARVRRRDRIFDLTLVLLLAPLLLPLALLLSLVVFLDSSGSIFYRARRIGLGGEPFEMLKFRTMRNLAVGPSLTSGNDERLTPVGRFLARSRMDELPQVLHVLTGRMRLVGPRPEDPEFVLRFQDEYQEILSVPPGITGKTQLIHFADGHDLDVEDPISHYAEEILPGKLMLDTEYVRERTAWLDLRIVARTVLLPIRLATAACLRATTRHSDQVVVLVALVGLVVIAFTAAGGPAR
jgi:lipopolysaccharide/colanic/teichoic acid biosynthesis glycosyltransferase